MSDQELPDSAKSRAAKAKAREIEAHKRAIKLHEDAVILFDRLHKDGKSLSARERAERAREMLRLALTEQDEMTSPQQTPPRSTPRAQNFLDPVSNASTAPSSPQDRRGMEWGHIEPRGVAVGIVRIVEWKLVTSPEETDDRIRRAFRQLAFDPEGPPGQIIGRSKTSFRKNRWPAEI